MNNELNMRFNGNELGGVRVVAISAEAANARTVSLQFFSKNKKEMTDKVAVTAYISSDANGDALEADSATLSFSAGTDGIVAPLAATDAVGNTVLLLVSEDDGDVDLIITQTSGADTHYVNILLPNGEVFTSQAITFAA